MDIQVTKNGEIALPSGVRERHKISPGTRLSLSERGEEIILTVNSSPGVPEKPVRSESLLEASARLAQKGRIDTALDLIYDKIDDLFHARKFEEVDSLLGKIDIRNSPLDILLGYLTATLPAKSRLPSRAKFFHDVEAFLRETGRMEEGLLSGLEP